MGGSCMENAATPPCGHQPGWYALTSVAIAALTGMMPLVAFAAGPPPSAGTILQQSAPPPQAPSAPKSVVKLPAPQNQTSQSSIPIPVKNVRLKGNTLLSDAELAPLIKPIEGQTVKLARLQKVAQRIGDAYHRHGYPLAYAFIPAQSVRRGVVTIRIVEPRFDRIELHNQAELNPGLARRTLGVYAGQTIRGEPLHRGLLLLGRTPGVRVGGTFVPGTRPATSSLDVNLANAGLFSGSVTEDNYGNPSTGRARTSASLTLANPLGFGSQLALNGLVTQNDRLHSGGVLFVSPNIWNGLRFGAYASRTHYRLGGHFSALDQHGHATQVGLDLSYPIVLQPERLLTARLDVLRDGFETKTLSVGADRQSHILLGRLTLSGARVESWGGVTTAGLSLTRGRLSLDSAGARVAGPGPSARGGFWIGHLRLAQRAPLPLGLNLHLSVSGQISSTNLDGSQKFYLGGPYGVMSYPVSYAGGDQGVLARGRLAHALPIPTWAGRLDLAALLQGGTVWVNRHNYSGYSGRSRITLGGAGAGLNYHWRSNVRARVAYVHTINRDRGAPGLAYGGEIWASLQIQF